MQRRLVESGLSLLLLAFVLVATTAALAQEAALTAPAAPAQAAPPEPAAAPPPAVIAMREPGDLAAPVKAEKALEVQRGYTAEAARCVECHAKETPGIVEGWRLSRMAHAAVSCYDCHVVEAGSPMASQCDGIKGTDLYTSPMVSAKRCAKCHPGEAEQFSKSGHAKLASKVIMDDPGMEKLMYHYEGGEFLGKHFGQRPEPRDTRDGLPTLPRHGNRGGPGQQTH